MIEIEWKGFNFFFISNMIDRIIIYYMVSLRNSPEIFTGKAAFIDFFLSVVKIVVDVSNTGKIIVRFQGND